MTGPRPEFDRTAAKRAGYTDEEIDAFLGAVDPLKPTTPRQASESTTATRDRAPARADADLTYAKGLARQGAQGASFGFADEIEAGLRSMGGRPYKEIRNEVRDDNATFARENPLASIAANVVGGVATGGGLLKAASVAPKVGRALSATGLLPKASATATMAQRIGQGVKAGAAAGAVGGAGVAEESGDVWKSAAIGAGLGGATGGLLSSGIEAFRGARNVVGAIGQGDRTAGPIRRAIRADAPEDAGAQRVLRTIGRTGKTLDDVAAQQADDPDILAEVIGTRGVRQLRTARSIGDQAPEQIESGLTERARNEVGRVRGVVTREVGEAVDDAAYVAGKKVEAQTNAGPLYEKAVEGRTLTDRRVLDLIERPGARSAYDDAVRLAANDGVPMPPAKVVMQRGQAKPSGDDLPTRAPGKADQMDDDALANLSQSDLRGVRRQVGSLSKLSDKELDAELMYLRNAQGADEARAAFRQSKEYAEYSSQKSIGLDEDARGMMSEMGFTDPNDFAQVARDAALAEKLARERAPKIAAVEKELARRQAAFGDIPDDAVTTPSATVKPRDAVALPDEANAPTLPTLDAKHVQYWKFGLDAKIARLEGMPGGAASKEYSQLIQQRNAVEDLLFEHADGWDAAQQAYAKPMQEADAFRDGVKRGRTLQPADADGMLSAPNAAERSRGVANTIVEDLDRLGDGAAGPIRNPAQTVMGSEQSRARVKVATGGDAEKQRRIEDAASNAARRLQTKNVVMAGSQTFDKFADAAAEGMDVAEVVRGASNPLAAVGRAAAQGAAAVGRQTMGKTMDAAADLLMAGAPGRMTRAEALEILKRMEPAIVARLERQLASRGAAGSLAARSALAPDR